MNRRMKALEPKRMFCTLINKKVTVLMEYDDYRNSRNKGASDTCYCENIIPCYGEGRKCRYSGISPLYPDPLVPEELSEISSK